MLRSQRKRPWTCQTRIGEGFTANGDIIAFGYDADIPINAIGVGHPAKVEIEPVGASVSGHIDYRDADGTGKSADGGRGGHALKLLAR